MRTEASPRAGTSRPSSSSAWRRSPRALCVHGRPRRRTSRYLDGDRYPPRPGGRAGAAVGGDSAQPGAQARPPARWPWSSWGSLPDSARRLPVRRGARVAAGDPAARGPRRVTMLEAQFGENRIVGGNSFTRVRGFLAQALGRKSEAPETAALKVLKRWSDPSGRGLAARAARADLATSAGWPSWRRSENSPRWSRQAGCGRAPSRYPGRGQGADRGPPGRGRDPGDGLVPAVRTALGRMPRPRDQAAALLGDFDPDARRRATMMDASMRILSNGGG